MSKSPDQTVMIIQARMGSSRLPGKSMLELAGAPLVERILERVKRCKLIDKIILAIPKNEANKPLQNLGINQKVSVFRGDEENVLSRYCEAAKLHRAKYVVRFPADNPVPEPSEIDRIVKYHMSLLKPGFSTNLAQIRGSGYPDGIGAEIFDATLLYEASERNPSMQQKEHVHLNFYDYLKDEPVDELWCPIGTLECPKEFRRPDLVLDVNTKEQYFFMKHLYEDLYNKNPNFGIREIIDWYDSLNFGYKKT